MKALVRCNKQHICNNKDCFHYGPHEYDTFHCPSKCSLIEKDTDCIAIHIGIIKDFLISKEEMEI